MRRRLIEHRRHPGPVAVALAAALCLLLLPVHLTLAGSVQPLPPVTDADGRLGLCDVLPGTSPTGQPWTQLAYDAGARVNRWELRWDRIEAKRNHWDFSRDDPAITSSVGAGLQVDGILIGTPGWAAASGQRPGNGAPRGLSLSYTDPNNLWAAYVQKTVAHYKGLIKYWEIWNEPDLSFFWTSGPDTYFRLLQVAYQSIKAVDPSARVMMAGMVAPDFGFLTRVLDDATRAPQKSFDLAAWHAYGQAQLVYKNVTRFDALLAQKGFNAPLWVTEDGFPASNPAGEPRQAAYVLQTVAYALAAGAARVLVYRASDDPTPKTWGLISASGTPRMGYLSFQVAAHYLARTGTPTYAPDDHLERFTFYNSTQRITLLWNRSSADLDMTVPADEPAATLIDWQGGSQTLTAMDGQFSLHVPGAQYNQGVDPANSVVGGPPLLLVEDNIAPPDLSPPLFIPPLPGGGRSLVLLNQSATPATALVAAADHPEERIVVHLPPESVQMVDLDLLAGPTYGGLYNVATSGPLEVEAVSSRGSVAGAMPSSTWFLASAPRTVTLTNTGTARLTAQVSGFGSNGKVRTRASISLPPSQQRTWTVPAFAPSGLSLAVQSTAPVLLTTPMSGVGGISSQPQSSWYAVRPQASALSIFNPDAHQASHVNVQFVGAHAVQGEQLQLAPHHSFQLPTHGAKAVAMAASSAVTVGYAGTDSVRPSLQTQPTVQAALTAAGTTTGVALFNPSQQPAHVTVTVVTRTKSTQHGVTVAPTHVTTLQTRSVTGPPRGVLLSSDVPVVASAVP